LARNPSSVGPLYTLDGLLMTIFGVGLIRAWQLLGVRQYGLFGGWLNPLRDAKATRRALPQRRGSAPRSKSPR